LLFSQKYYFGAFFLLIDAKIDIVLQADNVLLVVWPNSELAHA
jgi:hypothetical protein